MQPVVVTHPTSIGRGSDHYWFSVGPVVVRPSTYIGCFSPRIYLCYTPTQDPFEEVENYLTGGINIVRNVGETTLFFTSEQDF